MECIYLLIFENSEKILEYRGQQYGLVAFGIKSIVWVFWNSYEFCKITII